MKNQEAKKKNEETLKILRKEEGKLKAIKKSVSELKDSLRKESQRLEKQIEKLSKRCGYYDIVRIGDTAYVNSSQKFQHGLRQNEYNEFDLYDSVDQIIPPSKKKSHLGFKVGHQIRIKQEGFIPFRYKSDSFIQFHFPAGVDIVERGGSHYVLGESLPEEVKNPIVQTTIECFYEDGKALIQYYTTRNFFRYFEVVDLSNYESCSHLEWNSKKGLEKSFVKYLETSGLTEKIELEDNFGFRVGESIYIKSHEIILDNPTISHEKFERALGKDLHFMQSFYVESKGIESSRNCEWRVFGFVGDNVLVEGKRLHEGGYSHYELFSPEEIGLIIDLDYRLKKENYFDRLIYAKSASGNTYLKGIKKLE
jgi:hypothetical protein